MILSYFPKGETERTTVYATVRINIPWPVKIVQEDGQTVDLSTWKKLQYRVIRIDTRIERHHLREMGLIERKGGRYVRE